MKKSLLALSVSGVLSTTVQAESAVTLYGIIDAGLASASNQAVVGGKGRLTTFQDAQMLPSIYGFKGKEELSGGMTAGFVLEGGFNSGNGTHNSPATYQTQLVGREAKVTLGADWGTIGAGMQYDPAFLASIATEPRGMTDSLSDVEYWIIATVHNGGGLAPTATGALTGGIFDVNSITYTYAKEGVYVGLEYGFGGIAGSASAGRTASVGASYSRSGLSVSGSYAQAKPNDPTGATGGQSQITVLGLAYDFGTLVLRTQYGEFKTSSGMGTSLVGDVQSWGMGLDWKISPANKLNFAYYDARDNIPGGSTATFAVMNIYSLSKRTQIYGQVAQVHADATAGLSSIIGGIYVPGSAGAGSTNFLGVGIQHWF